jgi:hypothetical protein
MATIATIDYASDYSDYAGPIRCPRCPRCPRCRSPVLWSPGRLPDPVGLAGWRGGICL